MKEGHDDLLVVIVSVIVSIIISIIISIIVSIIISVCMNLKTFLYNPQAPCLGPLTFYSL